MMLLAGAALLAAGVVARELRRGNSKPAHIATALGVGFLMWLAVGILIVREHGLESMRDIWTAALLPLIPAVLVAILALLSFRIRW